MKKILAIIAILILSSCLKAKVDYNYPSDPQNERRARGGKFFNDDVVLYGKKEEKKNSSVSKNSNKLLVSAKEVIGELIEIDVFDEDLKIVSSKWQESGQGKEKTQITALITGDEVKIENVSVSIHKQYLDEKGLWQNKKLADEEMLVKLLKEKIINKAK